MKYNALAAAICVIAGHVWKLRERSSVIFRYECTRCGRITSLEPVTYAQTEKKEEK